MTRMTDRARRLRRPARRPRRCSRASGPRRRSGRGRLRVYLGMAPGRRQDLPDARGGPPARRTAGPTSSSASSRPTAGRRRRRSLDGLEIVPAPPDRVPRRRRRGDGHRRRHRPPPDRRPRRRAGPHERARARRARSAGRTSSVIRDAGIHVVSTCNVQHLESVADAVATITGAPGQRAPPGRGPRGGRRDRARRHEPARAPPADAPRQRLPARADRRSRSTASSPSRT